MAVSLNTGLVGSRLDSVVSRPFEAGGQDTLSEVYGRHYDRLMGFFVRRTHNRALAEDLTHDTIVRFAGATDSFDTSRPVWPYLKATANNILIDHLRRNVREIVVDADEEYENEPASDLDPEDQVVLRELLKCAKDGLPDRQMIAVDLRYERGWSVTDAAAFLGVSPATFGQLLFRARENLRESLEQSGARLQGIVLPVLLGMRLKWRSASTKAREFVQMPTSAAAVDTVVSVMVAASLGMVAVVSGASAQEPGPTDVNFSLVRAAVTEMPVASGLDPSQPIGQRAAQAGGTHDVTPPPAAVEEAPMAQVDAKTVAPELPADAVLSVDAEEDSEFVISHEVEGLTGIGVTAIGETSVGCDALVLGVLCVASDAHLG